jgi:5-methylcytosine-specific restriction protein A
MRIRNRVLVEQPVCQVCQRAPSEQVDHKTPVSQGGTDDPDNLQGICIKCHKIKTRKDLGFKTNPIKVGIDGYPIKAGGI